MLIFEVTYGHMKEIRSPPSIVLFHNALKYVWKLVPAMLNISVIDFGSMYSNVLYHEIMHMNPKILLASIKVTDAFWSF